MKSAFDANVPRLRPLGHKKAAEPTAGATVATREPSPPPAPEAPAEPAPPEATAARLREAVRVRTRRGQARVQSAPAGTGVAFAERIARAVAGVETPRAEAAPASPVQDDTLDRGRERVQRLRERLATALQTGPADGPVEPRAATEATRHLVESFQARLRALAEERDALEDSLAAQRSEGERLRAELAEGRQRLEASEATARERVELARGLMHEVEALGCERDQALERVAALKALDEQQTRLLGEAEAALAGQQARLTACEEREASLTHELEARAAEVAELHGRLARRTAERDELLERVQALEAEVQGLQETRQALAEIKRMVDATRL
jgi:DNA repair exonuclease SbcCD ATPase subunit